MNMLRNVSNHEQDRHGSSKFDDEVEHAIRDSGNSWKEIDIKMESTKQTKISIWIVISYIFSCSVVYIDMFLYLGSVLCMLECLHLWTFCY